MTLIDDNKPEFEKIIEHYKSDIASIRTGRATPALIENVMVAAYGTKTPLKQLASINVADAKSMTVEPWDKNLLKDVEKAIAAANLGLGTANEGNFIRIIIPPMTEENRKNLVQLLKEKTERVRISLRNTRDKIRDTIIEQEKNKELTEDDKYKLQKDLDELTGKFNDRIKELSENKEKEIMTV